MKLNQLILIAWLPLLLLGYSERIPAHDLRAAVRGCNGLENVSEINTFFTNSNPAHVICTDGKRYNINDLKK